MTTHILIPLKPLAMAKQRLSTVLGPDERRRLMISMLEHVCRQAVASGVGPVALATSEPLAARLTRGLGVDVLADGGLAWNNGLSHALETIEPAPAGVIYLAADLPLVTAAEIAELAADAPGRGVVIGRAHDGGTNALGMWPATAFQPVFGAAASAAEHTRLAHAAGLTARVVNLPGLALDVDTPGDVMRAATAVAG